MAEEGVGGTEHRLPEGVEPQGVGARQRHPREAEGIAQRGLDPWPQMAVALEGIPNQGGLGVGEESYLVASGVRVRQGCVR
jgi:hypothetical protein